MLAARRMARRVERGLTLIETLVVVAMIGLVAGIVLPAVQASRESARSVRCRNNLRQIGLALGSHLGVKGKYPYGVQPMGRMPSGKPFGPPGAASASVQLLPYLEASVLFNAYNFEGYDGSILPLPSFATGPRNLTATYTTLAVFLCPSDHRPLRPGNSYRACTGPYPTFHDRNFELIGGGGVFTGLFSTSPRDVRDGLSNTAGFSERLMGSPTPSRFRPDRDIWLSGMFPFRLPDDSDEMMAVCAATRTPAGFMEQAGWSWAMGAYRDTLYNHVAPPNWSGADCSVSGTSHHDPLDLMTGGASSARSEHPGGVNLLMLDGAVRRIPNSVDQKLWRALATRAGGETVSLDGG